MNSSIYAKYVLLFGFLLPLALSIYPSQAAGANQSDFANLRQQLSSRLEKKSEHLRRRFDLVLSRHQVSLRKASARCQSGERSACRLKKWQAFLTDIGSHEESESIYRVHRYVNRFRYVTDARNWRRPDFWAVPEQLFARGGDCEDYVIAKYISLRAIGIAAERLRVVVVYDRKKRQDHAVLVVFGPGGTMVLDNYHRRVMSWADMRKRYKPYYSLNENAVWLHGTKI